MKKYNQTLNSELGLLPKTNWTWFRAQVKDQEPWYTNGLIAIPDSPVTNFPTEPPFGMPSNNRRLCLVKPHPEVLLLNDAIYHEEDTNRRSPRPFPWKQLRITDRTERNDSPAKLLPGVYKPGMVAFESEDGAFRMHLQRHYVGLVERMYQEVEWYAQNKGLPLVAVKDEQVVAVCMPYIHDPK